MAPVPTIQIGVPISMAQDVVYGMPTRRTLGLCIPVATDLEHSMDNSTWVDVDQATDGSFETAAPFLRNHSASAALVILKSY